jgi:hypothetical protein
MSIVFVIFVFQKLKFSCIVKFLFLAVAHDDVLYLLTALISQDTTATRTVLENLEPSTRYMVGVTGVNSIGEGTASIHNVQTGKNKCLLVRVISLVFLKCVQIQLS